MRPEDILLPTPSGVCCKRGGFHIDPTRAVDKALITHGHSDHARAGHGAVLATQETLDMMRLRYGDNFAGSTQAIAYGEETVLQYRIRAEVPGAVLYYDPRLRIEHLVRADKMRLGRLVRQTWARGRYDARLALALAAIAPGHAPEPRPLVSQSLDAARSLARLAWRLLAGVWLRSRRRYPYPQNYLFERALPPLRRLSAFAEAVRLALARRRGGGGR